MIMQNKVTKFATAAVIILGVFLAMYSLGISPDGSSVAWASLAKHVQQIKTVTYKMHMTMKGIPVGEKDKTMDTNMDQQMTMSSDYGIRSDFLDGDKIVSSSYILFAEKEMITLMPSMKKYLRVTLTDDLREKMQQQSYDPRKMVVGFMDVDYVELGRKVIDGIEVEGVEVNDPKAAGGMFLEFLGRMWVDIKTDLPVLIEMEMGSENGIKVKSVITDFQWNIELDESDFAYIIPEDYKSMGDVAMPEMNAEAAIEGFKYLMEINGGKFPKTLNPLDLMKEANEVRSKERKQKREARKKAIEEADLAGIDPSTIPEVQKEEFTKEMQKRMMDEQMKIQGVWMFYMQLVTGKKDPAYYGDRITPEDKDMILMRWLNDKDGYTVIFADLSTGDFTVEQVVEMELELPEPPQPPAAEEIIEVEEVPVNPAE